MGSCNYVGCLLREDIVEFNFLLLYGYICSDIDVVLLSNSLSKFYILGIKLNSTQLFYQKVYTNV